MNRRWQLGAIMLVSIISAGMNGPATRTENQSWWPRFWSLPFFASPVWLAGYREADICTGQKIQDHPLISSKSAHTSEETEMLLSCPLFLDRRKQTWLVCSANPRWLRGSHPSLTGAFQAPPLAPDVVWGAEPPTGCRLGQRREGCLYRWLIPSWWEGFCLELLTHRKACCQLTSVR